jgi:hypothetical protein
MTRRSPQAPSSRPGPWSSAQEPNKTVSLPGPAMQMRRPTGRRDGMGWLGHAILSKIAIGGGIY